MSIKLKTLLDNCNILSLIITNSLKFVITAHDNRDLMVRMLYTRTYY